MGHDEVRLPQALRLRLELAKATGRTQLVEQLESELRQAD
jgi:hypothetical protein